MYIPKDDSEINFKTEEDRVAFWKFVEQDSYLKNHKGQYAEAYAARAPWVHRFDFRLLEDFEFKIGKTKHCFQLSFDIMNVGNLINSKWGISKTNTVSNSNRILKYEGVKSATDLTPVFSMYKVNGEYLFRLHASNGRKVVAPTVEKNIVGVEHKAHIGPVYSAHYSVCLPDAADA